VNEKQLQHVMLKVNNVNLHVVQAGPSDGPLVILLHGFPEFWYGWRKQIPAFVEAGYRVWVPDQRGYNLSQKPEGRENYTLDLLALDVVGLIDAAGVDKAYLVGHDWGAAVAWWVALKHPQRLHKLGILNVPHPEVMRKEVSQNPDQRAKSWYIAFFQLPVLPELLLTVANAYSTTRSLTESSRPNTFSEEDLAAYARAHQAPGAMTAMLNWYRSVAQNPSHIEGSFRITVPTQIIWGAKDRFLEASMAEKSRRFCDDGRLELIEDATHWVQHEEPERVSQILLSFFKAQD
jgi:epoxide hydrolase 4